MVDDQNIEIELRPIKKVTILEERELPIDELLKRVMLVARSGQSLALNWAEGVVFFAAPLSQGSDMIIEEAMKGHLYWASVTWALMPKYESMKKVGGIEIPVIDHSSDPHIKQVAIWLKKRKNRNKL